MRGRETEWELVLDLLESTRRGKSKVLLAEGEPGIGKSLLLASAVGAASDRGIFLAAGAADELSQFTPLAPLLAALPAVPGPESAVARQVAGPMGGGSPAGMSLPTRNIRARLEELASAGPVLASFDDLHLADPATLHALRRLPHLLSQYPLSWILAGRPHNGGQDALLFDILEREGAARVRLLPLGGEAQAALMADILGAVPDAALRELAACASGNPSMLTELLRGLVDEDAVVISGDRAGLVSPRVPLRLQSVVQERLGRLCSRTRQLLETGAVLGRSFRLEDAAAMLGDSPGALLAPVEEALAARVVVPAGDAIAFEHDLIWQAVTEAMAPPVRQALHRQAGEMLLERWGSAIPAARHLLVGARPGDPVVLEGLDRAAAEVLSSAPQEAAEMAVRALELTPPASGGIPRRTVAAVRSLTAAARWEDASAAAQEALAVPMPALETAQLRCALSSLQVISGRPADALAAADGILADPDLPRGVRDDAEVALLQALTGLRDNKRATQVASAILGRPTAHGGDAVLASLLVLALATWDAGRADRALDLATQAACAQATESRGADPYHADLFLASRLIDLRRYPEAEAIMNAADRAFALDARSRSTASPDVLRARMDLATGRLNEAAAEADSVLGPRDFPGARRCSSLASSVLGTVALRRGDVHAAERYIDGGSPAPQYDFVSVYEADWNRLVAAQIEEARNGPRAAMDRIADIYAALDEHRYLLMSDPASAAWLVRAALAARETERAEAAEAVMAEIQLDNPEVRVFQGCAEHARGVLRSDRSCLEQAVTLLDDPWARASAAEDLGALLAAGSPREAVRSLDAALDGDANIGAKRDAARIRRRLRRLGVRRRHWTAAKRPPTGWDSLTDTERSTSELVVQGLTNQQIADQLFISVHTVAFHLRQVYRKLGINSRVELARVTLQRSGYRPPYRFGGSLGPGPTSCGVVDHRGGRREPSPMRRSRRRRQASRRRGQRSRARARFSTCSSSLRRLRCVTISPRSDQPASSAGGSALSNSVSLSWCSEALASRRASSASTCWRISTAPPPVTTSARTRSPKSRIVAASSCSTDARCSRTSGLPMASASMFAASATERATPRTVIAARSNVASPSRSANLVAIGRKRRFGLSRRLSSAAVIARSTFWISPLRARACETQPAAAAGSGVAPRSLAIFSSTADSWRLRSPIASSASCTRNGAKIRPPSRPAPAPTSVSTTREVAAGRVPTARISMPLIGTSSRESPRRRR
jgi:DNA-binding CsgD family transcriptional regulator